MQKLLVRLFIKNYQDTSNEKVRAKYGILSGIVGIITNLILCGIKIFAGVLSASLSIVADGINNLSDAASSVVTLIGFKLSSAPADEEHPFGHERIEYISGMIVAIIIILVGCLLLKQSIEKIITPTDIEATLVTYIILCVSILAKLWQSIFYKKMSNDIDSVALKATSQDSLNDVIATLAVLAGVIIMVTTSLKIDGYLGLLVSAFIIKSGISLVLETAKPLIGETPTAEEIKQVSDKITSYDGVLGIHDLVIHQYGPNKKFITVHVEVDASIDIMISHDMVDNIERDFKKELGIDLVIHMDPVDIHDEKTLYYKELVKRIIHEYDDSFTFHDFRIVSGPTHTNLLFDVVIPIKYPKKVSVVKTELKELIEKEDEHANVVMMIDQMYDRNC